MKTRFIKERLVDIGRNAEWLASMCGISPVTMKTNILRGVIPGRPVLILMAQALECAVTDLIHEDESNSGAKTA